MKIHFLKEKVASLAGIQISPFFKNPIVLQFVRRPIVAGYKWILTQASIFVDHYFKEFYSKFENILTDSFSVIKIPKNILFDRDCFVFLQYTSRVCTPTFQ